MSSQPFDWQRHKRQLERVQIPEKVKCKVCKKIRNQNAFSKRQLEEVRKSLLKYGSNAVAGPGYAGCRNCIGHQNVELTCYICDKTKALECFSKNQRRDPDNARCTNCVQEHLDLEPAAEQSKLLEEEENVNESSYQSQTGDYTIESLRTLTINDDENQYPGMAGSVALANDIASDNSQRPGPSGGPSRETGSQIDEEDLLSMGGGVWVEQGRRRQPPSEPANKDIQFTAYDAQGTPHIRNTPAPPGSAVSVQTGWESWGISPSVRNRRESKQLAQTSRRNPGFAKIPGARVPKNEGPNMRLPEPTGPTIESDDEDDGENIEDWI